MKDQMQPNQSQSTSSVPGEGARDMTLTVAGCWVGAKRMAPLAVTAICPFGLVFGVAASQGGFDLLETTLMSALVFGAAVQFTALEIWSDPLPLATLLIAVFAVSARHILMGAALRPWVAALPPWQVYSAAVGLTDPNWAMTMQGFREGRRDLGLLVGSGLVGWVFWVAGTLAGAVVSEDLGDPRVLGLDVLMPAYFATVLLGLWRGRGDALPWLVAALAAMIAFWALPSHWYIVVGGIAGGLAGAWRHGA